MLVNFNQYKIDSRLIYHYKDQHVNSEFKILQTLLNKDILIITCIESVEPVLWNKSFNTLLKKIREQNLNKKILLVFQRWYSNFDWEETSKFVDDILFLDTLLLKIYVPLEIKKVNQISTHWDYESNEFLFFTGKPAKSNRIRLLYKLSQAGLLNFATWSLFVTDVTEFDCKKYLPELTADEFEQFIKTHQRAPDIPELTTWFNHNGYVGIPYDVEIYNKSLFALISETDFDRLYTFPYLTEKTWLHIANRLPFILANEHKATQLLEDMGFHTFKNYLPVPNYDNPDESDYLCFTNKKEHIEYLFSSDGYKDFYRAIKSPEWPDFESVTPEFIELFQDELLAYSEPILSDSEHRLDRLVYNCKYWLKHLKENFSSINLLVEENRKQYLKLGQSELDKLDNFFQVHKVNSTAANFILDYLN